MMYFICNPFSLYRSSTFIFYHFTVSVNLLYSYFVVTYQLIYDYFIVTLHLLYVYFIVTLLLLCCYFTVTSLLRYCYITITLWLNFVNAQFWHKNVHCEKQMAHKMVRQSHYSIRYISMYIPQAYGLIENGSFVTTQKDG